MFPRPRPRVWSKAVVPTRLEASQECKFLTPRITTLQFNMLPYRLDRGIEAIAYLAAVRDALNDFQRIEHNVQPTEAFCEDIPNLPHVPLDARPAEIAGES